MGTSIDDHIYAIPRDRRREEYTVDLTNKASPWKANNTLCLCLSVSVKLGVRGCETRHRPSQIPHLFWKVASLGISCAAFAPCTNHYEIQLIHLDSRHGPYSCEARSKSNAPSLTTRGILHLVQQTMQGAYSIPFSV